jgi:hypothetical protein
VKKTRIFRLALLPILAPIFLIGFALATLEKPRSKAGVATAKIPKKERPVSVGLLAELEEELVKPGNA